MRAPTFLLLPLLALFLPGCASVTVKDVDRASAEQAGRPGRFYVAPFVVDSSRVKENPARKAPGQLANEAQLLLSGYLISELSALGIPATAAPVGARIPKDAWLVSGRITRLAEGSRVLRMVVGLGSGGTKFETQVQVLSGAKAAPVLRFSTSGGSNAMPGGITNPIPFSGVPTALLNAKDGITADAARTARMITGTIGNHLAERGWISAARVPQVKNARP